MSRKDDLDNHSNQLNPNNDAYYSSRSGSGGDDDDDGYAVAQVYRRIPEPRPVYSVEQEYEFTVVTLDGQTCIGKVLISGSGDATRDLGAKIEKKALQLHEQVCDGVKRLSGSSIVYAHLNVGGRTVDELKPWEPTMPAGWSNHWKRVDRERWRRMERARSYRQQAIAARQLVDQAAAQVEKELIRLAGMATAARARALSNAATAFKSFSKAPIFRVKANWAAAVKHARSMDAMEVVQPVIEAVPGLDQALRTVDVLVRASNARAPASLRHPASFGYGLPETDAYGDYFGHKPCNDRLNEIGIWFTKGERRLRAVLNALGKPKRRYDFGSYDVTMQPDFHISKATVERAMKPANRR